MPFRAKMRKALGRSGSSAEGSDLTTTATNKSTKAKNPKKEKLPDNVYKPGEAMPRPKYRGPYNQAHQDKLSAFSFGDAWRRRKSSATGNSDMSPMGSRLMSRRGSAWSRRSIKLGSRRNSEFQDPLDEGEADGDVTNVGLSRQHTAEDRRPKAKDKDMNIAGPETQKTFTNGDQFRLDPQKTITEKDPYDLDAQKTVTNGRPFSEEELASAMSRSTLKGSRRERS